MVQPSMQHSYTLLGIDLLQLFAAGSHSMTSAYCCVCLQALEIRMRSYVSSGRHVLLVGDLNISPHPVDSCCPDEDFNRRIDRKWLQSLLYTPGRPKLLGCDVERLEVSPTASAAAAAAVAAQTQERVSTAQHLERNEYHQRAQQGAEACGVRCASSHCSIRDQQPAAPAAAKPGTAWDIHPAAAEGRLFVDVFRLFHSARREAYTCWSTATGARVNNYGSRIDHILAAQGHPQHLQHQHRQQPLQLSDQLTTWHNSHAATENQQDLCNTTVSTLQQKGFQQECSIQQTMHGQPLGAGHEPRYACGQPAGRDFISWFKSCDIWVDMMGSDHAPVWVDMQVPDGLLHVDIDPPKAASRYMFTGRQASLKQWLSAAAAAAVNQNGGEITAPHEQQQQEVGTRAPRTVAADAGGVPQWSGAVSHIVDRPLMQPSNNKSLGNKSGTSKAAVSKSKSSNRKGQSSLLSFLKPPPAASAGTKDPNTSDCAAPPVCDNMVQNPTPGGVALFYAHAQGTNAAGDPPATALQALSTAACGGDVTQPEPSPLQVHSNGSHLSQQQDQQAQKHVGQDAATATAEPPVAVSFSQAGSNLEQRSTAVNAWRRIATVMQPPKCKGHNEPCVIRTVKKKGDNNGRQFYVCARPDGPPPIGRCDFFMWANQREYRGQEGKKGGASMLDNNQQGNSKRWKR